MSKEKQMTEEAIEIIKASSMALKHGSSFIEVKYTSQDGLTYTAFSPKEVIKGKKCQD